MRERSTYRTVERSQVGGVELEEHSTRIKELLRADLIMLEEENAILKAKCKKANEQEEKIEMVLKQNSQLLSENERLSKLLHQKKQEYEVLRDKFEVQSSQRLEYATEFQYERKKLLAELDQLQAELRESQQSKNAQLSEIKAQFQVELQTYKRQQSSSSEVYEQEIRRLREQLDKKDYELSDAVNRLKRFSSQAEYDILRLKEEKEKLRSQLIYAETDRKKEMETLRGKLETNYLEEVEALKKNHLASLEGFELENKKLRDLLEAKTAELDQVSTRIGKQKGSFEQALTLCKRENEILRNKMVEAERLAESEKDTLKAKLNRVHESEVEEMRANHQKYIECLQAEITKLDATLRNKNAEIEQLIKEKSAVRQIFDSEGARFKEEIEALQLRLKDAEAKRNELANHYEEKLTEKARHIDYLDKLAQDQQQNFENETKTLKQIIEHQKSELDSEKLRSRERDQQAQETIDELKTENSTLRENLGRERADKDKQIDDLTYELESTITGLKTKADALASRNSIVERELTALKETVVFKEKEIKNLSERVRISDERERKLERENDELRSKLIKKDQKTNEMLAEQKQRLQATFTFTLDNLKLDHESSLKLQASKQLDLNERFRRKEEELVELLRAYRKMRDQMQALTEQQANKKDMTLKFPGATSDLIATKNLFDVFLKSRVLDLCSDVREKENLKK